MNLSLKPTVRTWLIAAFGVVLIQALVLVLFGQPLSCECGTIRLWAGQVLSSENSQQLSDWYTFSHIIHGFLFYALVTLLFPRSGVPFRLFLSLSIESTWEIIENTPMVINAYRQTALAQGYIGDSVINSISDTLSMVVGFLLAWRIPIALTIALALLMEFFVGYMIHDNLTLNILNFIHQFEFIRLWQLGHSD